jgi:hypothetical protein
MWIRGTFYTIQWILTLTIAVLPQVIVVSLLFIVVVLLTIAVDDLHFSQTRQGLQRIRDLFGSYRFYRDLIIGSKLRIILKT